MPTSALAVSQHRLDAAIAVCVRGLVESCTVPQLQAPKTFGGGRFLVSELSLHRGSSLIINSTPLGTYSRTMSRVLGGSWGGGRFLMGEVPL